VPAGSGGPVADRIGVHMDPSDVLIDAFERIRGVVGQVVDGLDADELGYRPDRDSNSIAWLVWHLTRIQDDHIADVAGTEQCWTAEGWADRFGLPFEPTATGYGQSSDEVELLTGYYDAVHQRTLDFVRGIDASELDRVVDESWDPPVTLGVRLISVIGDDLQHAGQAAFLRGIVTRRAEPDRVVRQGK
jgi:uncharacterized damage-inducible protein DinB